MELLNSQNMLLPSQTHYYKNDARKAVSHKDQTLQSYYRETMEKKDVYKWATWDHSAQDRLIVMTALNMQHCSGSYNHPNNKINHLTDLKEKLAISAIIARVSN